jgi:serine/threonine protein phosphatase PrpC
MKFSVFQVSRRGGREKNEDRMGYCYTRGSCIFLLADGMGGHPEGEVAAQVALQTISALYQKEAKPDIHDVQAFLSSAVLAAHRQILRYAIDKGMVDTPRTTVVAAVVQDGAATWVHCGDSRLYLVRAGEVLTRTRDHSYMEQKQFAAAAQAHPAIRANRNILFTCLGSPTKPVFDISETTPLQQGDRLMLCSDGLWSNLADDLIAHELGTRPVADAVPEIVEQALVNGGRSSDNVTVIAMEWETPDGFESTRASISTDSINEGVFASTVQAGWLDPNEADLDDDAIERSIAEINEAIRRTAAKRN